jgi:hypothetical protein
LEQKDITDLAHSLWKAREDAGIPNTSEKNWNDAKYMLRTMRKIDIDLALIDILYIAQLEKSKNNHSNKEDKHIEICMPEKVLVLSGWEGIDFCDTPNQINNEDLFRYFENDYEIKSFLISQGSADPKDLEKYQFLAVGEQIFYKDNSDYTSEGLIDKGPIEIDEEYYFFLCLNKKNGKLYVNYQKRWEPQKLEATYYNRFVFPEYNRYISGSKEIPNYWDDPEQIKALQSVLDEYFDHPANIPQMLLLGDFHKETEDQIKKHLAKNFKLPLKEFEKYKIIVAYEDYSYESKSWTLVLNEENGKLYENAASHCSCHGFEDQWEPKESSFAYLTSDKFGDTCLDKDLIPSIKKFVSVYFEENI